MRIEFALVYNILKEVYTCKGANPGTSETPNHPSVLPPKAAEQRKNVWGVIIPRVNTLGYTYFAPLGLFFR